MTSFDYLSYFSDRSTEPRDLSRFRAVLDVLGNPQNSFRCVPVGGTNGKGSTSAYIASILTAAGVRTGLYTSPALISVNERIRIDGIMVTDEAIANESARVAEAESAAGVRLSGFDRMTATAFCIFEACGVEYAVLEVGLGGRLDATNVVEPEVCVITTIDLDHTKVLGDTYEQIAAEKCGIIKPGVPVVCHPQRPEVMDVEVAVCRERDCQVLWVQDCTISRKSASPMGQEFSVRFRNGDKCTFFTTMLGSHQMNNATAAILAAMLLGIDMRFIKRGIENANWAARMEYFDWDPDLLVDGAHNPSAARALVRGLNEFFPDRFVILIVSIMADKDAEQFMRIMSARADYIIAVAVNERSLSAEELVLCAQNYTNAPTHIADSVGHAYEAALKFSVDHYELEPLIVVAGSLYLAGAMLRILY